MPSLAAAGFGAPRRAGSSIVRRARAGAARTAAAEGRSPSSPSSGQRHAGRVQERVQERDRATCAADGLPREEGGVWRWISRKSGSMASATEPPVG